MNEITRAIKNRNVFEKAVTTRPRRAQEVVFGGYIKKLTDKTALV